MSDRSNAEVVRQVYAAFVGKNLPAVLELQAQDTIWSVAGPPDQIPWAAPRHGRDGVAEFLRILGQWLSAEKFEIQEYLSDGDTVVALGSQRGQVRPHGNSYAFDFVHVWTLHDLLVTSFRVYYDTVYVAAVLRGETPARSG